MKDDKKKDAERDQLKLELQGNLEHEKKMLDALAGTTDDRLAKKYSFALQMTRLAIKRNKQDLK
jgi:hypothetical protein